MRRLTAPGAEGLDRFEIVRGEVVPMVPTGDVHGRVEGRVFRVLDQEGGDRGLGVAFVGEVGIVVETDPRTVRGADAAFVLAEQMPYETSSEGYLLTPPALVVEVLSPNDGASEVQRKVLEYLDAGVRVVWIVDPASQACSVYLHDGSARLLKGGDPLWAPGVLDDLQVPVLDLFKGSGLQRADLQGESLRQPNLPTSRLGPLPRLQEPAGPAVTGDQDRDLGAGG